MALASRLADAEHDGAAIEGALRWRRRGDGKDAQYYRRTVERALASAAPVEDEWPELAPLRSRCELPRIAADLLPSWAGAFALARATETPPELPLAMVLGACSAAASRR